LMPILFRDLRLYKAAINSGLMRSLLVPGKSPSSLNVLSQSAEKAGIEQISRASITRVGNYFMGRSQY